MATSSACGGAATLLAGYPEGLSCNCHLDFESCMEMASSTDVNDSVHQLMPHPKEMLLCMSALLASAPFPTTEAWKLMPLPRVVSQAYWTILDILDI